MLNLKTDKERLKAIRQFVHTFCIFRFKSIAPRELDLLCEILAVGEVNNTAKKNFILNCETTKENYYQVVKRLADKGILKDKLNRNGKELHESLIQLSEIYINGQAKFMILEWRGTE